MQAKLEKPHILERKSHEYWIKKAAQTGQEVSHRYWKSKPHKVERSKVEKMKRGVGFKI